MKIILKTIKLRYNLNYEKIFIRSENIKIHYKLISELMKSLELTYKPLVQQMMKWLSSLHKSYRSQAKLKKMRKINKGY